MITNSEMNYPAFYENSICEIKKKPYLCTRF